MRNESHKPITILNPRFLHEVQIAHSKLEIEKSHPIIDSITE